MFGTDGHRPAATHVRLAQREAVELCPFLLIFSDVLTQRDPLSVRPDRCADGYYPREIMLLTFTARVVRMFRFVWTVTFLQQLHPATALKPPGGPNFAGSLSANQCNDALPKT